MKQIPTPPSTPPPPQTSPSRTSTTTNDDLISILDTLLATYLESLDTHQRLHASLSRQFSSGFFALAQANRTSTTGRRYGEEGYDYGGMRATKRLHISSSSAGTPTITGGGGGEQQQQQQREEEVVEGGYTFSILEGPKEPVEEERPDEEVPSAEKVTPAGSADTSKSSGQKKEKKKKRPFDPLRQFGILVPPYLRSAQRDFVEGVEETITGLAETVLRMRALEGRITRVRQEIVEAEGEEGEERGRDKLVFGNEFVKS